MGCMLLIVKVRRFDCLTKSQNKVWCEHLMVSVDKWERLIILESLQPMSGENVIGPMSKLICDSKVYGHDALWSLVSLRDLLAFTKHIFSDNITCHNFVLCATVNTKKQFSNRDSKASNLNEDQLHAYGEFKSTNR